MLELEGRTLWASGAGLGGGVARRQSMCGALTGATVGLGLYYAQKLDDPRSTGRSVRPKLQELLTGFATEFGSTECREIIPVDFSAPDWYPRFQEQRVTERYCNRYVAHVARTLAEWHEMGTLLPPKG